MIKVSAIQKRENVLTLMVDTKLTTNNVLNIRRKQRKKLKRKIEETFKKRSLLKLLQQNTL
jgi:hypothetical protein